MASDSPSSAANSTKYRVHVFVDFWNFTLSMKARAVSFKPDWRVMPSVLTRAAVEMIDPAAQGLYQGMNVYGSYDDRGNGDAQFRKWATNVLDTFPGVHVSLVPRQKKRTGPKCPSCHAIVERCPSCDADMRGTEEKGVDTRLVTDMIKLAWEDAYDVAVLVSSDKDYVPVAEFLQTKGIKVIHGAFRPHGAHLSQKCWGSIDVTALRTQFRR